MSHFAAATARSEAPAGESTRHDAAEVVRHIAHELRQPLSTMEAIAYYLEITLPHSEGRARAQVEKLQQMVHQCNWILADAIHYLQASAPRLELADLGEVVSEALVEWSGDEASQIRYEPADALPLVLLDMAQAQHIACNLFTFFHQVSRGQPVVVRTWAETRAVCLEVSTAAPGYEADNLKSLFEPFGPHLPGGSGLGLASVRRIAEAHGATFHAKWDPVAGMSLQLSFPVPG